jgi:hypothetical protein
MRLSDMGKPILCIDFDGVLHGYESGWKGAGVANDPPVPGAANFLLEATAHFTVAIYSTRSKSLAGRACMRRYVREHLDTFTSMSSRHTGDLVSEMIRWPWFKPPAAVTIDDRALTFTGVWPRITELQAFKPWNKGGQPPPDRKIEYDLADAVWGLVENFTVEGAMTDAQKAAFDKACNALARGGYGVP